MRPPPPPSVLSRWPGCGPTSRPGPNAGKTAVPPTANGSARPSSPGRPTPTWPPYATPTRCGNFPRRSARAGRPCGPRCGRCGDGAERLARTDVSDPEGEEQLLDLLIDLARV